MSKAFYAAEIFAYPKVLKMFCISFSLRSLMVLASTFSFIIYCRLIFCTWFDVGAPLFFHVFIQFLIQIFIKMSTTALFITGKKEITHKSINRGWKNIL